MIRKKYTRLSDQQIELIRELATEKTTVVKIADRLKVSRQVIHAFVVKENLPVEIRSNGMSLNRQKISAFRSQFFNPFNVKYDWITG